MLRPFGKKPSPEEIKSAIIRATQQETAAGKNNRGSEEEPQHEEEVVEVEEDVQSEENPQPEQPLTDVTPLTGLAALFKTKASGTTPAKEGQLPFTVELTAEATRLYGKLFVMIENEQIAIPTVAAAAQDHDLMDKMLRATGLLEEVDLTQFMGAQPPSKYDDIIRSQQSKRSRSKSKYEDSGLMEDFRSMVVGAFAENIIRDASSKPKEAGGGGSSKDLGYTDDEWNEFKTDAKKLAAAIRNVQSKKSITKSKVGHGKSKVETDQALAADERWITLLYWEKALKALRGDKNATLDEGIQKDLAAKNEATDFLAEINADEIVDEVARNMIKHLQEILITRDLAE